jgi:hypothetical protein
MGYLPQKTNPNKPEPHRKTVKAIEMQYPETKETGY